MTEFITEIRDGWLNNAVFIGMALWAILFLIYLIVPSELIITEKVFALGLFGGFNILAGMIWSDSF